MTAPRPHTIVRITGHEPGKADYSGMTGRLMNVSGSHCVVHLTAMGVSVSAHVDHIEPVEADRVATIKSRLMAARKGTA
jgi:hypothetical protein